MRLYSANSSTLVLNEVCKDASIAVRNQILAMDDFFMEFELSSLLIYCLLFITALVAGTVDAIAGGGGLISLPVLLAVGIPPHLALGTNKLQGMVGTAVATYSFHRKGLLVFTEIYPGLLFGFIGSVVGSLLSQEMSNVFLGKLIPVLLFFILIYTLISPRLGHIDTHPKMPERWFYVIFGFLLSFYDGFFGPGTGSFWIFALVYFLGFNLLKASAYTKVLNLNSNIFAALCFAWGGNIEYTIGAIMALGQIIGGRLGAHLSIKQGQQLIRPIFMVVVSITIIILIYRAYQGG
jgi:uncharacterized membrane protein YfcA